MPQDTKPSQADKAQTNETVTIGLVSTGHFLSHFFILALPPLFPLMKAELDTSYTVLGGITAVYSGCSALSQYPIGILADRYGARQFLIAGLGIISLCFLILSFNPTIAMLYALAVVAGLADGVFHPCDFAILSNVVTRGRAGRAYSFHTMGGFAGFAAAPLVMVPLAALFGWQTALLFAGGLGLLVTATMIGARRHLRSKATDIVTSGHQAPHVPPSQVLTSAPLLLMLGYYIFSSTGNIGLSTHLVAILIERDGLDFATAGLVLPAFLWGMTGGIFAGGLAADFLKRLDMTATLGTLSAAVLLAAMAFLSLPLSGLMAGFALVGFLYGSALPSRDVVVRNVTPDAAVAQAFGLVNTGYGIGSAVGPLAIGIVLDYGLHMTALLLPAGLFLVAASFTLSALRFNSRAGRGAAIQD